jgi:hypothetical protein
MNRFIATKTAIISRMNRPLAPKLWLTLTVGLVMAGSSLAVVSAASESVTVLDKGAKAGMLMSLTKSASVAEPASDKNAASLLGVLAPDEASLDAQPGQTGVKTEGVATTLVSTLNGDIKVGDRIAPSSLVGIGAKAVGSGWIVGTAQGSLDAQTTGVSSYAVTDTAGHKHQVAVGSLPVIVKVTYYNQASNSNSVIPQSIQDAVDKLAGKHVRPLAIILSFVLILVGIVLAAQLVNGSTRSAFSAISRQPLTKSLILNKLFQMFGIAAGLIGLAFLAAYLILRFL